MDCSGEEDVQRPFDQLDDTTELHIAARDGNLKVLKRLLRKGFDVDARDSLGRTAFMMAVEGQHKSIMFKLVAAGADLFVKDVNNKSALDHFCADHQNTDPIFSMYFLQELRKKLFSNEQMARMLMEAGCEIVLAVTMMNAGVIEYMLRHGVPVNTLHHVRQATALHIAVMLEDVDTVQVLLEYNIDKTAVDSNGLNALYYVYQYNPRHSTKKVDILTMLLDAGLCPNVCNAFGAFQILPILTKGSAAAVRVLLNSSIDFNAKDLTNQSILHYLATNDNPGVVEELKIRADKLNVNDADYRGLCPLHKAASWSNLEMVKFLLEQGAEVDRADQCGMTPLHICFIQPTNSAERSCIKLQRVIELLLQYNANPQLFYETDNGARATSLDFLQSSNMIDGFEPIIAHLAMLQEFGTPIIDQVRSRIDSHKRASKYFKKCSSFLRQNICGTITVFRLLTATDDQMTRYLGNEALVLELNRLVYKQQLTTSFSYYRNTLCKRFLKCRPYKSLKDEAKKVLCKIYGENLSRVDLVIDKTMEFFNIKEVHVLCQMRPFI